MAVNRKTKQENSKSHLQALIGKFLINYIDTLASEDQKQYDGMQVVFKCKIKIR